MGDNRITIGGRQAYDAEAGRLRQLGWHELKPRLLPESTLGEWDGACEVARRDGVVRKVQYRAVYWVGYPWRKPTIWPVDPRYDRTLHLSAPSTAEERKYAEKAGLGDRLCIWDDLIGWDPELAEQEVPGRVHSWFEYAENGWSESEAQILDPERYFINAGPMLLAGNGLTDLKAPLGSVLIAARDQIGLIKSVDGRPCSGYTIAAIALQLNPDREVTVPYVLLKRQPTIPMFSTLRGLRDEATQQGVDGAKLIQHLRNHVTVTATAADHRKSRKNRQQRHHRSNCPQTQMPLLTQRRTNTQMLLRLLLIYPAGGQLVGCQLILPELTSGRTGIAGLGLNQYPMMFNEKQERLQASLGEKLVSGAVRSLDSGALLKRNPQRMNPIASATVMLLGLGGIGSMVAELLVKAGVKRVVLVDADILEPGNVIRHACGMEGVGKPKTIAVRNRLRSIRHDGDYEIMRDGNGKEIERCDIIENLDRVTRHAVECGLVLDCTGSEAVLQAVSRACRAKAVPFMSVGTYYSAAVGQILAVLPGQPCLECLRKALQSHADIDIPFLGENEAVAAEGCAAVTSPASAADLATTCSLAAQASIDVLLGSPGSWHQRLWIGRPLPGAPADSVFLKAPQVVDSLVDVARCDLCRD